ncbi:TetR/AcrR family transcriptional regulator [Parafrankia soli]|uniref:TetR/AcrR family transcriptional regulator n=1 Tax=Parafrankia soli TaxID=2599596 RepID=UPI000A3F3BB9|nr:TetR/AcrR family transcriptional regulator [Parafrankia soli]
MILALLWRNTGQRLEQLEKIAEADHPLREIWRQAGSATRAALLLEFMALANHRKSIQDEIGRWIERLRVAQLDAVTATWDRYGLDREDLTPSALLFMMNAIPRMMRLEESFGIRTGHADTVQIIERFLDRIEPLPPTNDHLAV